MSAVRRSGTVRMPGSNQIWLYVPGSPSRGVRSTKRDSSARSSIAAASSSVRYSCPANCAGRSSGVRVEPVQIPWRSGSPHAVRRVSCPAAAGPSATSDANATPVATPVRPRLV